MDGALSPYRLKKARGLYNTFNALNALSFTLLSGNIVTLYALRLGASSSAIGLLNSFVFIAFFFMPVGKRLVSRFPIVRVFAAAWLFRYVLMIPLLFAPFAASRGRADIGLTLMLVSVFFFHASRGIGLIGNNPVLNELASGSDKGAYITSIQVINSAVAMVVSFALALLLGRSPPLALYGVIVGIGIVSGVAGSLLLFRVPEPPRSCDEGSGAFFATAARSFRSPPFRLFIAVFFIVSFVSSVARAFSVVYSREAYLQGDGAIALFTVFGGLGALTMGLLTRLLVDRIGSKPLYIGYTLVAAFSLVPVLVSPSLASSTFATVVFLSAFHFSVNFGFAGAEGVAQTYFFALVKPDELLNLGILYYFVFGAAGALGSISGGVALDGLASAGFSAVASYRIFFALLTAAILLAAFLQRRLVRLGSLSFRGALGVIFSFRDLKALTILDRLEKSRSSSEEEALLGALHDAPSAVAISGLLDRLKSPRLSVRLEALSAIEALGALNAEAEACLVADLDQNPYTTAYVSARILGKQKARSAFPALRRALDSDDYMLAGEAMLALARLDDEESLRDIEARVARARNPRMKIMGVAALETYDDIASLQVLLDLLRAEDPPPYLRDEVALAMASLLGILDRFYPVFLRYAEDPTLAAVLALDEVEAAFERSAVHRRGSDADKESAVLREAVAAFMEKGEGASLSQWIRARPAGTRPIAVPLLAEAVLDDDLTVYSRFRLLVACWAADSAERGGEGFGDD
ncbi:MAG TPA: MFS transporter [Treponema sp.]|nr:MAG: MFS transporter [Treponema sp. GWC1_61_84]HCM28400.1 MFS transporter [Treponema sp.]